MINETLRINSIEGLLSQAELTAVRSEVSEQLRNRRREFTVAARSRSVHSIAGESVERAKEVYEPQGRVEFDELPKTVADLIKSAVDRRIGEIQNIYPSVRHSMDWFYVEYEAGQFITPHVDYPHNERDPAKLKIAAISVVIDAPVAGGEFFVETSCSDQLWGPDGAVRLGADGHSEWFAQLPRTRWRVAARPGDAICWGTQLVHGTEPVIDGVTSKLIGFLSA